MASVQKCNQILRLILVRLLPKAGMIWRTAFQSRCQAAVAIGRWIDGYYNPVRRHSTLDHISPIAFERAAA
ncbi:IS3 family transposase [Acuticoccus sediminis]|uniref:IS3 family transposase n=1 Tax=Acuticoccus sediminis TaxID=2184697 RepID=UPI00384ED135